MATQISDRGAKGKQLGGDRFNRVDSLLAATKFDKLIGGHGEVGGNRPDHGAALPASSRFPIGLRRYTGPSDPFKISPRSLSKQVCLALTEYLKSHWSAHVSANPVEHSVLDPIASRWSPYRFDPREVEDEKLLQCLEAARWAASSFNDQPWFWIVARRQETDAFERMLGCLMEPNQAWASRAGALVLTALRGDVRLQPEAQPRGAP